MNSILAQAEMFMEIDAPKLAEDKFSQAEMWLLYGKAVRHFAKAKMMPIDVIYRNKPREYFENIYELGRSNPHGMIMESYAKNASGHPECPIIGKLTGLYFATFAGANGLPPPSSPFGEIRMSVDANYMLDPAHYRFFFADFYCSRSALLKDSHIITLVVCVRGSDQERFGLEHLVELDPRDNPFLEVLTCNSNGRKLWHVAVNNDDKINLFIAHHFNISNALASGKCTFSSVEKFGRGYALPAGQTYDSRCRICNVREQPSHGIHFDFCMSALSTQTEENVRNGWRLWLFECFDLPEVCPCCKKTTNGNSPVPPPTRTGAALSSSCLFCDQIQALRLFANQQPGTSAWSDNLTPAEFFPSSSALVQALNFAELGDQFQLRPSQLCKHVSLNRKIGVAFFREGIPPDYDSPLCASCGIFVAHLGGSSSNAELLHKIDCFFLSLINGQQIDGNVVAGIFLRIEVSRRAESSAFTDPWDLPCTFKMEIWSKDGPAAKHLLCEFRRTFVKRMEQYDIPKEHLLKSRFYK